jgi:hypothetical protein
MGMTINARNLEKMINDLMFSGIKELEDIALQLFLQVQPIASSIIKVNKSRAPKKLDISNINTSFYGDNRPQVFAGTYDKIIAASLLFENSSNSIEDCTQWAYDPNNYWEVKKLYDNLFNSMDKYDIPPRSFELCNYSWKMLISASCYAQLKRHRITTQIVQDYDIEIPNVIPPIIQRLCPGKIDRLIDETEIAYEKLLDYLPKKICSYVLTNSHCREIILGVNLRELYHMARLRCSEHAQWEIRELVEKIVSLAQTETPLAAQMLGKQ